MKIIKTLHSVLCMLKGFNVAHVSSNDRQMIMSHEGDNYIVTFEKIKSGEITREMVDNHL